MRISETARAQQPGFIVIPQNGIELITLGDDANARLTACFDGVYLDIVDAFEYFEGR